MKVENDSQCRDASTFNPLQAIVDPDAALCGAVLS